MDLLRDMALFVEVARARSFTKAAERLQMPTSSVSRRVGRLEKQLGIKLFRRTTREVRLTEAGAVYLQRCAVLVDEARVAHEDIEGYLSSPRGKLRISLTADFATVFLAPLLVEFRGLHPDITFDIDVSPRRVDLHSEPFDMALRIGALEDSSLVARRLALLRVGLYASPNYIKARGLPKRPEDLARHSAIRVLYGVHNASWNLSNGKESRRIPLESPFAANNLSVIRSLAILGAGIGVMDEGMALDDVRGNRLIRVLPSWTLDRIPLYAIMATRFMPAKTRAFVDFLATRFAHLNKE